MVINEFLAHTDLPAVDFIELYNYGSQLVDLSGWRFTDGISFAFPEGTVLPARGYLVVARTRNGCSRAIRT